MAEHTGNALFQEGLGNTHGYIDIHPPFNPANSTGVIDWVRDEAGVDLSYPPFAETANTTRLFATIVNEETEDPEIRARFEGTARFLADVLNCVDRGEDHTAVQWSDYYSG